MTLADLLLRQAHCAPDRSAILSGTRPHATHAEWAARAAALARRFRQGGLRPGDRVALYMRNHPRYLEVLWGAWWAGLAVVPINARLHLAEAEWIVAHAQARWIFVTDDVAPQRIAGVEHQVDVGEAAANALFAPEHGPLSPPVEREPDDLAWLFYTSGTTGRPKGVMLTHRNLITMGLTLFRRRRSGRCRRCDRLRRADVARLRAVRDPAPMAGARHVVPLSGGCRSGRTVRARQRHRTAVDLCRADDRAPSRRACRRQRSVAGRFRGRLQDHRVRRRADVPGRHPARAAGDGAALRADLWPGRDADGRTALSRAVIADVAHPRHAQRLASVGVAQTPVRVRVVDEDGRQLPPDQVGEVVVRGDSVMAGYWRNDEATRRRLRDGWLWTGDVGSLDADGFLTLKDRSKDLVISGGSNIYPREVEEVLLELPGVAEAAVVGRAGCEMGRGGGRVRRCRPRRRRRPMLTLDAHCLQRIARFKRPRRYLFVDTLPKNNYGKVLKTALRAQLVDEA